MLKLNTEQEESVDIVDVKLKELTELLSDEQDCIFAIAKKRYEDRVQTVSSVKGKADDIAFVLYEAMIQDKDLMHVVMQSVLVAMKHYGPTEDN